MDYRISAAGFTVACGSGWKPDLPSRRGRGRDSEIAPTGGLRESDGISIVLAIRSVNPSYKGWGIFMEVLSGLAIAFANHSVDPSLISRLIAPYRMATLIVRTSWRKFVCGVWSVPRTG